MQILGMDLAGDNPMQYILDDIWKPNIQVGPGRKTISMHRKQMNTSYSGAVIREANRRNGVGRPPKNKEWPEQG